LAIQLAQLHEHLLLVGLSSRDRAVEQWQQVGPTIDVATLRDRRAIKLLPLVWRSLAEAGVQDPQLAALEAIANRTRASNELLFEQLRSALEVLDIAGIRTLGLKGVPLVVSYYLDSGLRPMSDADLLVDPTDAARTIAVMREAGWRLAREPRDFVGRAEATFASPDHEGVVDVHWRLDPWVTRNAAGRDPALWAAASPIDVLGHEMLAPAPHDLALHVVLHAYRSEWERVVRWVPDLVLVLRDSGALFDWDVFVQRVETGHLVLPVREALEYVRTTFDAPVPGWVIDRLHAARPSRRERRKHRIASTRQTQRHWLFGQGLEFRTRWARVSVNYARATATRALPAFLRARADVDHLATWPFVVAGRRIRRAGAARADERPPAPSSRSGQLGDGASERL